MGIADLILKKNELEETDLKRVINGKLHWHYTLLKNWPRNEELRLIKTKDWERLGKNIQKNGVKDDFEIGQDGTTYDGNHRLKKIHELVAKGIRQAENGKSLEWVPVNIHNPKNEVEELTIAAEGNNDDFAIWNKDAVANNQDMFIQIPGYEEISFDFEDPVTFGEVFESYQEPIEEELIPEKKSKELECPNCHEKFTPK